MIDLLEKDACDNHYLASLLLAQAGLPCGPEVCECGSCPIEITEFKIDVHRILITANGRQFELLVNGCQPHYRERASLAPARL